ncbi:hypothetical protein [Sporosarcina sp.]|uniref:hypothetical protein n=1 Tax=Sporosarcina sp. TaxID=49982 RepID=UPI00261C01A3|nr:hypothetical protein [Sporosarcina sp.]
MRISGNQFITDPLKNLTPPKKNDSNSKRESITSESQRHIEDLKRMVEEEALYQKRMAANQIAKKIARGESVTNEEREQLKGMDEEGLRKAEQANLQRKQLSARLANATTKEQARAIILEGKLSAGEIIEKGDEQYGEFLMEAVNKAEDDHYAVKRTQSDMTILVNNPKNIDKPASLYDIRL